MVGEEGAGAGRVGTCGVGGAGVEAFDLVRFVDALSCDACWRFP